MKYILLVFSSEVLQFIVFVERRWKNCLYNDEVWSKAYLQLGFSVSCPFVFSFTLWWILILPSRNPEIFVSWHKKKSGTVMVSCFQQWVVAFTSWLKFKSPSFTFLCIATSVCKITMKRCVRKRKTDSLMYLFLFILFIFLIARNLRKHLCLLPHLFLTHCTLQWREIWIS